MEKSLKLLFGTVSEEELDVIRSKLSAFEKDQLALVQVEKDSISILNITRMELAGNRRSINQLGKDFFKNTSGARKYHRDLYDSSIRARRLHEKISSLFDNYQPIASKAANLIGVNTRFESSVEHAFFWSFISKYRGPNPSQWPFIGGSGQTTTSPETAGWSCDWTMALL